MMSESMSAEERTWILKMTDAFVARRNGLKMDPMDLVSYVSITQTLELGGTYFSMHIDSPGWSSIRGPDESGGVTFKIHFKNPDKDLYWDSMSKIPSQWGLDRAKVEDFLRFVWLELQELFGSSIEFDESKLPTNEPEFYRRWAIRMMRGALIRAGFNYSVPVDDALAVVNELWIVRPVMNS